MISLWDYNKNARRKRWVLNFDFKISNDLECLTSNGNAFQSLGAVQVNDLSPLYAEDCKTSRVINCPVDHSLFQSDIDNIYRWSLQNRMEFNVKKCKLMRICKKRSPLLSDLHLNNSTLQSTSDFSDLGLVTNCNLSWNNHIDKITSKANKILEHIKRTFRGL